MNNFRYLLLCAAQVIHFCAFPQSQDSVLLDVVEITASVKGSETTSYPMPDQLQALSKTKPVWLQSSYPGGLSTISIGGLPSQHTSVIWNGVNLQYPMNGTYDLSLLPISFYEVNVNAKQSLPDRWRGLILDAENLPEKTKLQASISKGSFGSSLVSAAGSLQKGVHHARLFTQYQYNKNSFPFRNPLLPGMPVSITRNAEVRIFHLGSDYKLTSKKDTFSLHSLITLASRQIPPSLTEVQSTAIQSDSAYRFSMHYHRKIKEWMLNVQAGYVFDINQYEVWIHRSHGSQNQVRLSRQWSAMKFMLEYRQQVEIVQSNSYNETVVRHSGFLSTESTYMVGDNLFASLRLQSAKVDDVFVPLSGNSQLEFNFDQYKLHLQSGYIVRQPGLNDLYWPLSGNKNLKPETCYFHRIALSYDSHFGSKYIRIGLAPELKYLNNFIQWVPSSGILWRPENVQSVRIAGSEFETELAIDLRSILIRNTFGWIFNDARVMTATHASQSGSVGKQLIYQPKHQVRHSLDINFNNSWNVITQLLWSDLRYTTRDNSAQLPTFLLADVHIQKKMDVKPISLICRLSVLNLNNQNYQLQAFRQMPGRSFHVGLDVFF
jgi:vitamin B12 transporter